MNKILIKKIKEWVLKNRRLSSEPLYAWVDLKDLLDFIKSIEKKYDNTK